MLTALFCFSQEKYPRKAIIDGDTVGIFTIGQVRQANQKFAMLDECREQNDSCNAQVKNYSRLNDKKNEIIAEYKNQVSVQEQINAEQTKIILNLDKQVSGNEKRIKFLALKNKALTVSLGIVAVAAGTTYLLTK